MKVNRKQVLSNTDIVNAKKAISYIAAREGKSIEEIRNDIYDAILAGNETNNQKVKAEWKHIASNNNLPTPEEVIAYYAKKLKHQNNS